jgi:hypothetical protein
VFSSILNYLPAVIPRPVKKYKHVNWLNVTFIIGIPLAGCIQAFWVPLQLKTALTSHLSIGNVHLLGVNRSRA